MQIQNLQIFQFSTAVAAAGPWIDVSNLVSMSVQINSYSSGVTDIQVSNDPNVNIDGAAIGPPSSAPVLSQFASLPGFASLTGGSNASVGGPQDVSQLPATTFYVKTSFVTKWGETTPSAESSLLVTVGNYLFVAAPTPSAAQAPSVIGWNCYVGLTSGGEVLQGGGVYDPQRLADGFGTPGGTVNPLGPSSSTHFTLTGALPLQQNFSMVNGFQATGFAPPGTDNSGGVNSGVSVTSGAGFTAASDSDVTTIAVFTSATQIMWTPSSMTWKWLRVVGGVAATTAYLNGQRG